jgi:Glycosyltransferase like family 2
MSASRRRAGSLMVTATAVAAAARQVVVLGSIARSRRFLSRPQPACPARATGDRPAVHVVVPMLREAAVFDDTLAYFAGITADFGTLPIIVTTAREKTASHGSGEDTIELARAAAAAGHCVHLHHPDPAGLKGDQLNQAASHLLATTPAAAWDRTLVLCYDADSRPSPASLAQFAAAATRHPGVDVFHQSSRFELRARPAKAGRWWTAILDAGALRANRFVLAYELPRLLNRSPDATPVRRGIGALTYTHVTGHGLCLRLRLLDRLPFPARSPLEDMHYSFLLGSLGQPAVAIPGLDNAEVPASLRAQFEQAARWFAGPGRFTSYLRDPRARPGPRTAVQAVSAALISAEWLSCAVLPPLLPWLFHRSPPPTRLAVTAFTISYAAQLVLADTTMEPDAPWTARMRRLLAYPAACELFGVGGWLGAARLARRTVPDGKTERGPA